MAKFFKLVQAENCWNQSSWRKVVSKFPLLYHGSLDKRKCNNIQICCVLKVTLISWKSNIRITIIVKLREREGQRVDLGRSLKGHL